MLPVVLPPTLVCLTAIHSAQRVSVCVSVHPYFERCVEMTPGGDSAGNAARRTTAGMICLSAYHYRRVQPCSSVYIRVWLPETSRDVLPSPQTFSRIFLYSCIPVFLHGGTLGFNHQSSSPRRISACAGRTHQLAQNQCLRWPHRPLAQNQCLRWPHRPLAEGGAPELALRLTIPAASLTRH